MSIEAQAIVDSIAKSEADYHQAPERFSGFVRKATKARIDFFWKARLPGKPDELTVNRHGVICSRTVLDGKTWYGYTLKPFGEDVSYLVQDEVAQRLLELYVKPAAGKNGTPSQCG